jgi:hypothetical protein
MVKPRQVGAHKMFPISHYKIGGGSGLFGNNKECACLYKYKHL